jgi:hypothetical protein
MKKKIIINKQNTDYTSTDNYTDTESTVPPLEGGSNLRYKSLVDSTYRKSRDGSIQDNLTREDILDNLDNYIPLKTMQEKRILTRLPYFKTWIKYFNTKTRQFRIGGLLMKVEYPDYIMLVNTAKKITWSVQLKDNIIYIPEDIELNDSNQIGNKIDKKKEKEIKDKLFKMYKNGELSRKR